MAERQRNRVERTRELRFGDGYGAVVRPRQGPKQAPQPEFARARNDADFHLQRGDLPVALLACRRLEYVAGAGYQPAAAAPAREAARGLAARYRCTCQHYAPDAQRALV